MTQLGFNKIIIHHSKTADGKSVSWDAIKKYHIETNHWNDIGYHFGIETIGNKVKLMIGRPLTECGAHCSLHNSGSIGICIIGDYDIEKLSIEKEMLLTDLCVSLCLMFGINSKEIYGDRDFHQTKTCPGNVFPLRRIKENINMVYKSYLGIKTSLLNELSVEKN